MAAGFSQKTCLPAPSAALEKHRVKVRRGGDQHHVHVAVDQLLVGVETDEAMGVVDGHLFGLLLLQQRETALDPFGEDVGHGHQPHVFAGVHGVGGRPAASASATDQAHLDRVAAGGMGAPGQR